MIHRHLAIAIVGAGALALAGCGSKQVPDVVGMNPQEAIEAMHAADLNTNSHGGFGLEEGTGFVVCETNPKAGETTGGEVEIYSRRDCKPKTSTAKADVKRATEKARDRDGDGDATTRFLRSRPASLLGARRRASRAPERECRQRRGFGLHSSEARCRRLADEVPEHR